MSASQEGTPVRSMRYILQIFIFSGNSNICVTLHSHLPSWVRKQVKRKWALPFRRPSGATWPGTFISCCLHCRGTGVQVLAGKTISDYLPPLGNTQVEPQNMSSLPWILDSCTQCDAYGVESLWEVRCNAPSLAIHLPCFLDWAPFPFACGPLLKRCSFASVHQSFNSSSSLSGPFLFSHTQSQVFSDPSFLLLEEGWF